MLKFILLTVGIFFGISIAVRVYSRNSIVWWSMLMAALAFAGYICLR